jgi:hypothetical protein
LSGEESGSERKEEKRRYGIPKFYYWAKSPPKLKKAQTSPINVQQKKFYLVQLAFRTAKVTAIVMVLVLFFTKI